ncbi:MAG: hypothetical protein AB8B56_15840 [Crocinitomicaceae bacterium]
MKLLLLPLFLCLSAISFGQVDDSLELNQDLEEVVISISQGQSEFYAKKDHYILDIIEDSSGIILLLKNRGKYFIEKVLWDGQVIISEQLMFKASKLEKDCLNNLYLIMENGYQRFSIQIGALSFDQYFNTSSYQSEIESCVASSDIKLLFKRFMNYNQSVLLWKFDYADESSEVVYLYEDSVVTKANNDEAQSIKEENYTNHARMKEISIAELKTLQDQLERATFFESTITQAIYTPVFSFKNDHYFFNFKNDSIYAFDDNFELNYQICSPIKSQDKNGLRIIHDSTRGTFYFYSKKSSLTLFSLKQTKLGRSIESVGIHSSDKFIRNGWLYFLGKSSVGDSYNKLFREKL